MCAFRPYDEYVVRPPTSARATGAVPAPGAGGDLGPTAGALIGGRYRLERLLRSPETDVTRTDGGVLWRAHDQVLSRPVVVRLLVASPPSTRAAFLAAAVGTGRCTDPLVAATYDAAAESPVPADDDPAGPASDPRPLCFLVREWVDGQTLRDVLLDGPLSPERATAVLRDTAAALAHVHETGYAHGRVHPANVLVRTDGQIRLCDAAVGVALAGETETADLMTADTIGLGRTLYAALTGRWPDGTWRGLAPAPRANTDPDAPPLPARQVRAGVPRELDAVVSRILDLDPRQDAPPLRTPAAVAAALAALPTAETDLVEPRAPDTRRQRRRHPWRLRAVLGVGVLVLAGVGWSLGQSLGRVPSQGPDVPAFSAQPSAGNGSNALIPIKSVASFDPPPGDGSENPAETFAAHDGEQGTAWQTQRYTTADLGNIKPGVGLLVDLGTAEEVSRVDLTFLNEGTDVELRAMPASATSPGTVLADFAAVAQHRDAARAAVLTPPAGTVSRYWLVWLTRLPHVDGGYRGAIAEMAFRH